MEHLISKIADISKRENCSIFLGITPDNKIIISVLVKRRIMRKVDADQSEECILNIIMEAIKTSERGVTL
jgi:hypothetical protein